MDLDLKILMLLCILAYIHMDRPSFALNASGENNIHIAMNYSPTV